jgi:hypothetical protein
MQLILEDIIKLRQTKPRMACACGNTAGWDMFERHWCWRKLEHTIEPVCPACTLKEYEKQQKEQEAK